MIRIDRSVRTLPGKTQEGVTQAKRNAEFITQNSPVMAPVQVFLEILGNVGTVHMILEYDNLGTYEQGLAQLRDHRGWRELLRAGQDCFVPGTVHDTAMVSV